MIRIIPNVAIGCNVTHGSYNKSSFNFEFPYKHLIMHIDVRP